MLWRSSALWHPPACGTLGLILGGFQRVETVTGPQKQPREVVYVNYETFLKLNGVYIAAFPAHRMCKDRSMFEVVIAIVAFASASIFLAHAVEAYLVH